MKRKSLIALVLAACLLAGCGGKSNDSSTAVTEKATATEKTETTEVPEETEPPETEPVSAYDALSDEEKIVMDYMKSMIPQFKNPESVRLLNISKIYGTAYGEECDGAGKKVYLQIRAENGFGAQTSTIYILHLADVRESGHLVLEAGTWEEQYLLSHFKETDFSKNKESELGYVDLDRMRAAFKEFIEKTYNY